MRKMSDKINVYAYENCKGDKGIIIAESIEEARKIFKEEYPKRIILDKYQDFYAYDGKGTYLFEVDPTQNGKLYCAFPWV